MRKPISTPFLLGRVVAVVGVAAALCAAGCWRPWGRAPARPKPKPRLEPHASARIARPRDLIPGPAADGRPGDYVLENELIRVIISDISRPSGGSKSGGNIRDACDRRTGADLFKELFTFFNDTYPRQAIYDAIDIVSAGGKDKPARIRTEGADCENPGLRVRTTYELAPGQRFVKLTTVVENHTGRPIKAFALGDAIQWGATEHFAAGYGYDLAGKRPRLEWVAGVGDGASYGLFVAEGRMETRHGAGWSDVIVTRADLPQGGAATYTRCFAVGIGGSTGVTDELAYVRGVEASRLSGRFVERGSRRPVAGAAIEISDARGRLVGVAKTDADGWYSADLKPGVYGLRPTAPGRSPFGRFTVRLEKGRPLVFNGEFGRSATVELEARDEAGRLIPAKFTFLGRAGTPAPRFGSKYRAAGARNVVFAAAGRARVHIAPGNYAVIASRGIEYTLDEQEFFVTDGGARRIQARLKRVTPTAGYLAADLHQHTRASYDSALGFADRLITDACEGVEIAVVTDHDRITDLSGRVKQLGLDRRLLVLPGEEVTTDALGHFNGYPLPRRPDSWNGGAVDHRGLKPAAIFARLRGINPDAVVQVNHPRAGAMGYFNRMRFDPKTGRGAADMSFDFDALEVLNGKYVASADRVLRDWFALLNAGRRVTAVGGSDSHMAVTQEAGCPRTLLFLGVDDPAKATPWRVADAIKNRRRAIVTNGPVVYLMVDDRAPIGSQLTDADGEVLVRGIVVCAPWIQPDRIEFIVNGRTVEQFDLPRSAAVKRFDRRVALAVTEDSWVVALVTGDTPMRPVYPDYRGMAVTPFAVTNPIWIDADGDGKWTPPSLR